MADQIPNKAPKGTYDIVGLEAEKFLSLRDTLEETFQSVGAAYLETPVFERNDVLMGKYGDEAETKLVYKLEDQGGELLSLRYDLTVPLMRYVSENRIKSLRRWSIGKVYRRDQPNPSQARYREFYQADIDIVGEAQGPMVAEALLIETICRVLDKYTLEYEVIANDVRNLYYILEQCSVPREDWKRICTVIDKLDKVTFDELLAEGALKSVPDPETLRQYLTGKEPGCPDSRRDYELLTEYLGPGCKLRFSNALARGLEYYTGFIWEVKCKGLSSSVAAGGRYDGLVSGLSCIGTSFGVTRLCTLIQVPETAWREAYFLTTVGDIDMATKFSVRRQLLAQGLSVTMSLRAEDRKLGRTIQECAKSGIRYLVIIAEEEWKSGRLVLKDLQYKTQGLLNLS